MKISHTPGISFSLIRVCCRLFPWQQAIVKITIFFLISTYLLPFLEFTSVKYLETRQSYKNDLEHYFSLKKNEKFMERILKNSLFLIKKKESIDNLKKKKIVKKASLA